MELPLKGFLFLLFLLSPATAQLETDFVTEADESTRHFILEQNGEMRKFFKNEMQNMLDTISNSFDRKLTEELRGINETLRENHQQLSHSLANLREFLTPPQTEVEEVNGKSGTIEFNGGANSNLRRKIWVFQSKSYLEVRFVLEENGLGEEARLSTWGSFYGNGTQHVWNGSQSDWRKERSCRGNLVLLTVTINPSAAKKPSFKLAFTTSTYSDDFIYASEVVLGKGRQVVSFPPNNTKKYPSDTRYAALIAPLHGRPVQFTQMSFDIPGTQPNNCYQNLFYIFFLEEDPTGLPYRQLPPSAYRPCGNFGDISELLGNSTVAIVRLWSWNGSVVRGFRVEANPI